MTNTIHFFFIQKSVSLSLNVLACLYLSYICLLVLLFICLFYCLSGSISAYTVYLSVCLLICLPVSLYIGLLSVCHHHDHLSFCLLAHLSLSI